MQSLEFYINNPRKLALALLSKFGYLLSDKLYLQLRYRLVIGKKLHLKHPQTFNEKLQWLKLYDRRSEYTIMVDKVKAKEYVASKIGEKYIIPTLGVWESPDDINFDALPDQFVLKCNHSSGGLCICTDKRKLDIPKVKEELRKGLRDNYYLHGREWPYKDVPRRILAEKLMVDESDEGDLKDYKMMCFDGSVKCSFVCSDRSNGKGLKVTFFDREWKKMPFERHYPSSDQDIKMPKNYQEMIRLSEILSEKIPFVHSDFYEINGQLYFGELTFFPGCGWEEFTPEMWDEKLGELIILPLYKLIIIKNKGHLLVLREEREKKRDLRDYKFFCFDGEPKLCQVISDRTTDEKIDFYDMDWNRLIGLIGLISLSENIHNSEVDLPCPCSYNEMKKIARVLSKGLPFSRIDFYEINGNPYFGEITFYPACGFGEFRPHEWNTTIGDWLHLPTGMKTVEYI